MFANWTVEVPTQVLVHATFKQVDFTAVPIDYAWRDVDCFAQLQCMETELNKQHMFYGRCDCCLRVGKVYYFAGAFRHSRCRGPTAKQVRAMDFVEQCKAVSTEPNAFSSLADMWEECFERTI